MGHKQLDHKTIRCALRQGRHLCLCRQGPDRVAACSLDFGRHDAARASAPDGPATARMVTWATTRQLAYPSASATVGAAPGPKTRTCVAAAWMWSLIGPRIDSTSRKVASPVGPRRRTMRQLTRSMPAPYTNAATT